MLVAGMVMAGPQPEAPAEVFKPVTTVDAMAAEMTAEATTCSRQMRSTIMLKGVEVAVEADMTIHRDTTEKRNLTITSKPSSCTAACLYQHLTLHEWR